MRKKSKYKPKGVRLDTMAWIKSGMLKAAQVGGGSIILDTRIKNHNAIDKLRLGQADKDDVDILIQAFNVTEALAIRNIGEDFRAEIKAGQDALYNLGVRSVSLGRFVATGPELNAINLTMEIHDAQLDICTVAEMEGALDDVWDQIKKNKARRIPAPA
jgi:hypothetical protein